MENHKTGERPFTELDRLNINFWIITYIFIEFIICLITAIVAVSYKLSFVEIIGLEILVFVITTVFVTIPLSLILSEYVLDIWLRLTMFNKRRYLHIHNDKVKKRAINIYMKKLDKIIVF